MSQCFWSSPLWHLGTLSHPNLCRPQIFPHLGKWLHTIHLGISYEIKIKRWNHHTQALYTNWNSISQIDQKIQIRQRTKTKTCCVIHQFSCVERLEQDSVVEQNTNIFLMWLELCSSNPMSISNAGEIVYLRPHF